MKRADIRVGPEYHFAVGKSGPSRAVVLDLDHAYGNNRYDGFYVSSADDPSRRNVHRVHVRPRESLAQHRFLIAVAVPVTGSLKADPDTGVPWRDHSSRNWGITCLIDWCWVPYAARAADIRGLWDPALDRRFLPSFETAVARGRREEREMDERAEQQRIKSEAAKVADAERRKVRAANQEHFNTRVLPGLIEAGLSPDEFRFDGRGPADRVEIDREALAGLLSRLVGEGGSTTRG